MNLLRWLFPEKQGRDRQAEGQERNAQSHPSHERLGPEVAEPGPDLQLKIRLGSKLAARRLVFSPNAKLSVADGGKVRIPKWEKVPTKVTFKELLEAQECWENIKAYRNQFPEWSPEDLSIHGAAKLYWFPKLLSHAQATMPRKPKKARSKP